MVDISNAMNLFLISVIVCLAVLILCCLFRAIKGPRITDRVVAINMIGSLVIIIICIFAIYLKESYLIDVAIVYAMLSFVATIVLSKVYTGVYLEEKAKSKEEDKLEEDKSVIK